MFRKTSLSEGSIQESHRVIKFHEAIRQGEEELVLTFLQSGINVDADINFESPLATAAQYGRTRIAEMLVEHGCSVNSLDRYLKSPLFVAVQSNDRELVKVLVQAGANLKHKRFNGYTPLHEAVSKGHDGIVMELLSAGADVHAVNNGKETPLHVACLCGHTAIVQMLLDAGASVNVTKGPRGVSPIHLAAFQGSPETIHMLVNAGADVDCINKDNKRAPIHFACIKNNYEGLEALLSHGCNVNILSMENDEAKTPLLKAIECGNLAIIHRLIDSGADINRGDHYGVTPLITSIFKFNPQIVAILLRAGCDVNKPCRNKLTAFTAAVDHCAQYNIAKMVLLAGYRITPGDVKQLQKLPITETMSAEDLSHLQFLISGVASLKRQCRQAVRCYLGDRPARKFSKLPLPQSVRDYLDFPELDDFVTSRASNVV
ncbi:serine/threonine-protein phosphatase 6 regulatory ankyrin repeat subunit C-like isoform X1 [Haliotis rubra]|uniref:serine/threonine-protein phosphatase 6 regulatory ankyrin repeat subunit C-like isoform X1 n=1 Tax=Haliotis rubra TaxID=36100 RepID=UPI001EE5A79E|nr:serine/threonine-protein phosphatase 6 regulatory ankyrin repeat subunit C-like isoform X1 [Haliotis rubra]